VYTDPDTHADANTDSDANSDTELHPDTHTNPHGSADQIAGRVRIDLRDATTVRLWTSSRICGSLALDGCCAGQ
jgi:hypothetical protein